MIDDIGRPLIMGVVNATPDSFSDGGRFLDPKSARSQIELLFQQGADIVDIGAESSRPGAATVDVTEEWQRLSPILKPLASTDLIKAISVDTRKPDIMRRVADLGVGMINDISGGRHPHAVLQSLATYPVAMACMHMHGDPETMQKHPMTASHVVSLVDDFFSDAERRLIAAGFDRERIWMDPGIGFGKTDAANLRLMAATRHFSERYSLLLGISRKSWIGRLLEINDPVDRDAPSKTMEMALFMQGARMIRTHDVVRLNRLRSLLFEGE